MTSIPFLRHQRLLAPRLVVAIALILVALLISRVAFASPVSTLSGVSLVRTTDHKARKSSPGSNAAILASFSHLRFVTVGSLKPGVGVADNLITTKDRALVLVAHCPGSNPCSDVVSVTGSNGGSVSLLPTGTAIGAGRTIIRRSTLPPMPSYSVSMYEIAMDLSDEPGLGTTATIQDLSTAKNEVREFPSLLQAAPTPAVTNRAYGVASNVVADVSGLLGVTAHCLSANKPCADQVSFTGSYTHRTYFSTALPTPSDPAPVDYTSSVISSVNPNVLEQPNSGLPTLGDFVILRPGQSVFVLTPYGTGSFDPTCATLAFNTSECGSILSYQMSILEGAFNADLAVSVPQWTSPVETFPAYYPDPGYFYFQAFGFPRSSG